MSERSRRFYQRHKESVSEKALAYYYAHREERKAYMRAYAKRRREQKRISKMNIEDISYMQIMFQDKDGRRFVGEVKDEYNKALAVQLCEYAEIPNTEDHGND